LTVAIPYTFTMLEKAFATHDCPKNVAPQPTFYKESAIGKATLADITILWRVCVCISFGIAMIVIRLLRKKTL